MSALPLDTALAYASRDLPVFPLHSTDADGHCSCGRSSCDKPGQHPVQELAPRGVLDATLDEATIRAWWGARPTAKVGIAVTADGPAFADDGRPTTGESRRSDLIRLTAQMRELGVAEAQVETVLLVVNERRCQPPLPESEVRGIAAALEVDQHDQEGEGWPEPPDPAAHHGLAGHIVSTIGPHSEADPVALLVQVLVAFGNATGRGPHFRAEADEHHLNIYAVLVGTTSKGRKGSSWGHVERLVREADPDWLHRVASGLSSGEGLIHAVRDPVTKTESIRQQGRVTGHHQVVVDAGVADKRLLAYEPEFASVLKVATRDGSTLSTQIRQAWDRGNLRTLTKTNPERATGAHVSIVGHITRDELRRELTRTEAANGFANRFPWLLVRRSKVLPQGGRFHEQDTTEIVTQFRRALTFARTVGEMRRDPQADELWEVVYSDLSDGVEGMFGAIIARAEAQVMRFASVYALLDLSPVIRAEHLMAALALWDYCERSAAYIFGNSIGDPVADEIYTALLKTPGGMTRNQIRDLFGRHQTSTRIGGALALLLQNGLVEAERERTRGAPAERWKAVRGKGGRRRGKWWSLAVEWREAATSEGTYRAYNAYRALPDGAEGSPFCPHGRLGACLACIASSAISAVSHQSVVSDHSETLECAISAVSAVSPQDHPPLAQDDPVIAPPGLVPDPSYVDPAELPGAVNEDRPVAREWRVEDLVNEDDYIIDEDAP